jgi:hypothetical protein
MSNESEVKPETPYWLIEDKEERFTAFLKHCREEVKTWPEWKQDLLGWSYSKKKAMGVLNNGHGSDEG